MNDRLADDIGIFRRAMIPDFLSGMLRHLGDAEPNLLQVATLYILDSGSSPTVGELADRLGRSKSVTSRMIDQLVTRSWVDRTEDANDRRAKRLAITADGKAFLRNFEGIRAEAQRELMGHLTVDEQRIVAEGMTLLGKAAQRRIDEQR